MMRDARDELRSEVMALLAASQELPTDLREHLVEAFLSRLETERRSSRDTERLRALYRATVPVNPATMFGIALTHGVILFLMGHFMLDTVLGLPVYATGYMPAWVVLGVLWVMEVLVTVAVVSIVKRRDNPGRHQRARHTRMLKT